MFTMSYYDKYAQLDAESQYEAEKDFLLIANKVLDKFVPQESVGSLSRSLYYKMAHNKQVFYHNHIHVLSMFQFAEKYNIDLTDNDKIAILYHDSVYYPGSKSNEEYSALYMQANLRHYISADDIDTIENIILDTKKFMGEDCHPESQTVLDLDLSGFIYDDQSRDIIAKNICNEMWTTPQLEDLKKYYLGRIKFLEAISEKGYIFRTEFFKKYDDLAIENIKKEIEDCKNKHVVYPDIR